MFYFRDSSGSEDSIVIHQRLTKGVEHFINLFRCVWSVQFSFLHLRNLLMFVLFTYTVVFHILVGFFLQCSAELLQNRGETKVVFVSEKLPSIFRNSRK